MADYHVGAGCFAINAVRDYMVQELLGGLDCTKTSSNGYQWTLKDGRIVELRVTIKDGDTNKS